MLLKSREELTNELIPVLDTPDPFGSVCCSIEKGFECNAGNCLASVTWDGKMYACLNAMVGGASLLEMSYADAWTKTSRSASEVLRPVECVGCAYDKICPKCLSSRVRDLQSGHCNPAVCRLTRRLVSAGIKKIKSSN